MFDEINCGGTSTTTALSSIDPIAARMTPQGGHGTTLKRRPPSEAKSGRARLPSKHSMASLFIALVLGIMSVTYCIAIASSTPLSLLGSTLMVSSIGLDSGSSFFVVVADAAIALNILSARSDESVIYRALIPALFFPVIFGMALP